MSNSRRSAGHRPSPVSIRFTDSEKALIRQKAGGLPLGTYVKQIVLGDDTKPRAARRLVADTGALGQILGLLGQSRIANNLNQLAKAVHLGALPVEQEIEFDLREACQNVALMRALLLRALGQMPDRESPSLTDLHAQAAAGRPA